QLPRSGSWRRRSTGWARRPTSRSAWPGSENALGGLDDAGWHAQDRAQALALSDQAGQAVDDMLVVGLAAVVGEPVECVDRAQRSEEHTSELQSPCNLVC